MHIGIKKWKICAKNDYSVFEWLKPTLYFVWKTIIWNNFKNIQFQLVHFFKTALISNFF